MNLNSHCTGLLCRDDFPTEESRRYEYLPIDADFWKMNSSRMYVAKDGSMMPSQPRVLGILLDNEHVMKYRLLVYALVATSRGGKKDNATFFAVYPSNEKESRVEAYSLDTTFAMIGDDRDKDASFCIDMPDIHMAPVHDLCIQHFETFMHWKISWQKGASSTSGPNLRDKVQLVFFVH